MSFLKKGAAAHAEMEKADLAQAASYGAQRFWIKDGSEARITFIDGGLVNGLVDAVSFYQHGIPRVGRKGYDDYVCTQETEACPICEGGGVPSLVFAFTILDHREYEDKNGKKHQYEKRLYVCKRDTMKLLQKKAEKMTENGQSKNGLVGVTFDVTRIGEKSPQVGNSYDFVACTPIEEIADGCGLKLDDVSPYDYSTDIKYFSAAELRKMGFGVSSSSVGSADTKALAGESKAPAAGGLFSKGNGAAKSGFNASKEL